MPLFGTRALAPQSVLSADGRARVLLGCRAERRVRSNRFGHLSPTVRRIVDAFCRSLMNRSTSVSLCSRSTIGRTPCGVARAPTRVAPSGRGVPRPRSDERPLGDGVLSGRTGELGRTQRTWHPSSHRGPRRRVSARGRGPDGHRGGRSPDHVRSGPPPPPQGWSAQPPSQNRLASRRRQILGRGMAGP